MSGVHSTPEWHRARRTVLKVIRARLASGENVRCVNCGRAVVEGDLIDVGHIIDDYNGGTIELSNLGAAHRSCNRRSGGRLGAMVTNAGSRRARRLPSW